MRVLIVGAGAREHALAWRASLSPSLEELFVAPGNAGTADLPRTTNLPIASDDVWGLVKAALQRKIDLVIVGPEQPLFLGLSDRLRKHGIAVFGPSRKNARLEKDKAYAKNLMERHGIPTAAFRIFRKPWPAHSYVKRARGSLVIKEVGPAQGKGVTIHTSLPEAGKRLDEFFRKKADGGPRRILVEEYLGGEELELSAHYLTDGIKFCALPFVKDHKHLHDFGQGPMTGGMGAYGPIDGLSQKFRDDVEHYAGALPALELGEEDHYIGCIYPGLMRQDGGLGFGVLEWNVRWGDPECQVHMRLFDGDLCETLYAVACGKARDLPRCITELWAKKYCVCVVLTAPGYPDAPHKGEVITGLKAAEKVPGVVLFHGGTARVGKQVVTNGGRILSVTGLGETLAEARARAYLAAEKIAFNGRKPHFRTDIALPYLDQVEAA